MSALRPDLQLITAFIHEGSSVLDIGCNTGELLAYLQNEQGVRGRGMELSQQGVNTCITQGLAVVQGNADTDLTQYPEGAFDFVILSQTLQALHAPHKVLEQTVRIGKRAIISVPNFGHWRNRIYLAVNGRMPVTNALAYQWYDTPNIHFCTIEDFIVLCEKAGLQVEKQLFLTKARTNRVINLPAWLANIYCEQAIFVVKKR